jgi:hypothetical protein
MSMSMSMHLVPRGSLGRGVFAIYVVVVEFGFKDSRSRHRDEVSSPVNARKKVNLSPSFAIP